MSRPPSIAGACLAALLTHSLWVGDNLCAAPTVRRVAVIVSDDGPAYMETVAGLEEHLSDHGVEVQFERYRVDDTGGGARDASGHELGPGADVHVALGTAATRLSRSEFGETPTVASLILAADDIEGADNATAIVVSFPIETQLRWIRELMPRHERIGVLYDPEHNQDLVDRAAPVVAKLGGELVAVAVGSPRDIPAALKTLTRSVDVLWGVSDPTVLSPQTARQLLLFSFRNRIPFIGLSSNWVEAGAIFALEGDYRDLGVQCGETVERILRGASPGSVPVSAPRKVHYSLNLKTARHMKLEIPNEIVQGARQVYQ
jgi:putative ABC transport system substrate-binding protein